ncbi:MAG TPA: carboxypeptidase regulatory-like domain-containing protein [Bryobacteraceae bacterium]|nr:carboxypeptidase regulatory-like domain-containing protein [Bryobacteraceae bacterium]
MRFNALIRSVALVAAVLLLVLPAFAQSDNSTISGFVNDPSGAAIANAKVVVKNEGTAFERQTTTNETGFFTVPNLAPGYYSVAVEAPGFKTFTRTRNKLEAAIPISVTVDMAVGQLTESVNVEASVAQLNTESATVGKTVDMTQIQNMSLNGRNPLFLALLKPGVRGGALNGFNFGLSSGSLTINGGRSQDSLITFDGAVGIRTRANGISIGTADLDTVQEVQILTANYGAEYGRSAAGQVRMVTKSGGKDFHGTLYEYFRNSQLDANSWARNRDAATNFAAPFRFNQFGYNINGPVMIPKVFNTSREKLFFLWSQEWVRYRKEDISYQRVPTELMRQGNFSELLSPNIFYSGAKVINNPATGQPYPGNIIPQSELSANGLAFLRTYPSPTGLYQGNNNWYKVRPNWQNQRKDTVAIDYNPTQSQVIRFRHAVYSWKALDAFRSGFDYAITDWDRPNKTASVGHIWTLGPTMINEFLISGSVDRVIIGVDREGERYLRSRSGINYPYIFPERKEIYDKVPTIVIPNVGTIDGGPYPSSSTGPIYQLSNNFTKIHANHTFKFGALWERSGQNDFDQINVSGVPGGTNNQNGRFEFNDTRPGGAPGTGIGLANAAMGLFSAYAEIGPRAFTPYRSHMFEFFGQDSWRVTNKLKLEIGARATWMNGYYKSLWGNIAVFRPDKYDPSKAVVQNPKTGAVLSGDRFNGVVIPGKEFPEAGKGRVPAIDSGEYDRLLSGGSPYPAPNQFNVMPRFGLAYQMTSKQVIRAGFGGFMARPGVYDNVFLGGNPPWQPMVSVTNGIADYPGGAAQVAFPQFFMTIDPAYKVTRAYNWNLSYQREIGFDTTLEVGYVGTTGNYLARERDLNQLPTGTTYRPENLDNGKLKYDVAYLRPYKGFANINMEEHSGRSTYHAIQLEANRRFKSGLSYGFAYTLSKAMDNASAQRDAFIDVYNPQLNWGKSGNDTRHVAVANFIYEMPFFAGSSSRALKTTLGGWQVSGVMQFQTGTPFTIARSDDYLGIGSTNNKPWNLNGSTTHQEQFSNAGPDGKYTSDPNFWFNPKVNGQDWATKPANGTLPNQNRNSIDFHHPGFQNWNLALFKYFPITESHRLQFRAEAFNWLNHPNWSGAGTDPTNATFGKVTGKSSERNLQLSLRYSF